MENLTSVLGIVWFALLGLAALIWPDSWLRLNVGLVRWFEDRRLYPRWAARIPYWICEPHRGRVILRFLGVVFLVGGALIAREAYSP